MNLLAEIRSFIDRLAERVTDQKIRPLSRVPQIRFKGVVIRVRERLLRGDRSVIGAQWPACSMDDFA